MQGAGALDPAIVAADRAGRFEQGLLVLRQQVAGAPAARGPDVFVHRDPARCRPGPGLPHFTGSEVAPALHCSDLIRAMAWRARAPSGVSRKRSANPATAASSPPPRPGQWYRAITALAMHKYKRRGDRRPRADR